MTSQRPQSGKIVWHDLMSTDPKASLAFYTELLGWRTKETDMGEMGKYTMFFAGETGVGGIMPLDKAQNVPSHWIAYITVGDADAVAERITKIGGKILVPPMDIPDVGKFATAADPTGGVTSPIKEAKPAPEDNEMPAVGTFCWEELMTTDPAAAVKFYQEVYGWSTTEKDMGEMGMYTICSRGDRHVAGIMKNPPETPAVSYWVPYVAVDDVDATTARVEKLGGKIVAPPTDIPNMGRFSWFSDPTGAVLALFKG